MPVYNLPSGVVGASSELRAASDLILRGYEVFRSVSPACSCDLVILKNGLLQRIEVRSGWRNNVTGALSMCRKSIRADVLAIVLPQRIEYEGLK